MQGLLTLTLFQAARVRFPCMKAITACLGRWQWRAIAKTASFSVLPLTCACHVERVPQQQVVQIPPDTPAVQQPTSPSHSSAPLTPFRALLENAWSGGAGEEDRDQPEAMKGPPGVLVLVAGPEARAVDQVSLQLCEELTASHSPLEAVAGALSTLECSLQVDSHSTREALIADSQGRFGAALVLTSTQSAALASAIAYQEQRGLVLLSTDAMAGAGAPWPLLPLVGAPASLQCPVVAPSMDSPQAAQPDAGATQEVADAGVLLDAGEGADASVVLSPDRVPARMPLVMAAARDEKGLFVAGVASVDEEREGLLTTGQVSLPMRRLFVGSEGVVLVDPMMSEAPPADAAAKAYSALIEGNDVAANVVWMRGLEVHAPELAYIRFIHVDTSDVAAHCSLEAAP